MQLLGIPDPETALIQEPFGSLDYVFGIAVDYIRFRHRCGDPDFGLLCDLFKLNGGWCAAVGRCPCK